MKIDELVHCENCGAPHLYGDSIIVNSLHYCSEHCAQANVPIIGGNARKEDDEAEIHDADSS